MTEKIITPEDKSLTFPREKNYLMRANISYIFSVVIKYRDLQVIAETELTIMQQNLK